MLGLSFGGRYVLTEYFTGLVIDIDFEQYVRLDAVKIAAEAVKHARLLTEVVGEVVDLGDVILAPDGPLHQLQVENVEHVWLIQVIQR